MHMILNQEHYKEPGSWQGGTTILLYRWKADIFKPARLDRLRGRVVNPVPSIPLPLGKNLINSFNHHISGDKLYRSEFFNSCYIPRLFWTNLNVLI